MADTTTPLQEGGAAAIDPYAGHTPIMRQYLMLKDKHPGVLLLYRLGDFYETFFDDAIRANRILGLTLTRRGKDSEGNAIPMAGVPAATLEQYLARLVKAGVSVAVCEQMSESGSQHRTKNRAHCDAGHAHRWGTFKRQTRFAVGRLGSRQRPKRSRGLGMANTFQW